jgi:hypothetical protein
VIDGLLKFTITPPQADISRLSSQNGKQVLLLDLPYRWRICLDHHLVSNRSDAGKHELAIYFHYTKLAGLVRDYLRERSKAWIVTQAGNVDSCPSGSFEYCLSLVGMYVPAINIYCSCAIFSHYPFLPGRMLVTPRHLRLGRVNRQSLVLEIVGYSIRSTKPQRVTPMVGLYHNSEPQHNRGLHEHLMSTKR